MATEHYDRWAREIAGQPDVPLPPPPERKVGVRWWEWAISFMIIAVLTAGVVYVEFGW